MSETKFTPGPWKWWTSNSWKRLKHDRLGFTKPVLEPYVARSNGHPDCDVSEADMALIAAAPELYEALQRCLAYIERDELAHGRQFGEGNEARSALAKASGASP